MNTKLYCSIIMCIITNCIFAQSIDDLKTTADYSSGERQYNAEYSLGIRYLNGTDGASKDPTKAFNWFKKSANHGSVQGFYAMGWCYRFGNGVAIDINEAIKWYEKSAKFYNPTASLELAKLYIYGNNIPENGYKGIQYAKIAAFREQPEGKYMYALCFSKGIGTQADSIKAKIWAYRAIDDKYYSAYWLLGNMYLYGNSVSKNHKTAMNWYLKGDEKNEFNCQYSLGRMYEDGIILTLTLIPQSNSIQKQLITDIPMLEKD